MYNSKTLIFTAHLFNQKESNNYYLYYVCVNYWNEINKNIFTLLNKGVKVKLESELEN